MPPPKYKGHHNHRHQNKKGEGSGMGSHQAQAEMKQLFNSIDKQMDAYQEELMDNYFDFENPIYLLVISNDFLRYLRGLQTCSYYQHKRMDEILINNELIDSHKKPSSTFFWPDPKHAHLNYILSDRIGSKHLVVINEAIWEQLVEFGFKGHKIIQKFFRIYEGTKFSECFMYPEQEVSSVSKPQRSSPKDSWGK
jgi:hypothetical protein